MADLMQFNQNFNDAPTFTRAFINAKMNPDTTNLKRRKQLPGVPDELGLPSPKHKCYEIVDSECATLSSFTTMITEYSEPDISSVLESTQDSSSFPGDAHSTNVNVKVDSENADSYDEASTSWDDMGLGRSRNSSVYGESSTSIRKDEFLKQDMDWNDMDGLEECGGGETIEEVHEFHSSSVVDPNVIAISSETWDVEQRNNVY